MRYFKYTALLLGLVMMFSACGSKSGASGSASGDGKPDFVNVGKNGSRTNDKVGFQFDTPEKGEEIVVIKTAMGEIKLRIFDKSAPIAAKSFKLLIKQKAYDKSTFHRIIKEFMIQGGQTAADADAWGGSFGYEYNKNLRHFRGALAMAHSSAPSSNGSQFYIVQKSQLDSGDEAAISGFDSDTQKLYRQHGGTAWLDGEYNPTGGHTVFGQVFEGMDVVDEIASVKMANASQGTPQEEVQIISIRLEKYS